MNRSESGGHPLRPGGSRSFRSHLRSRPFPGPSTRAVGLAGRWPLPPAPKVRHFQSPAQRAGLHLCGIATFTTDLAESIRPSSSGGYECPDRVSFELQEKERDITHGRFQSQRPSSSRMALNPEIRYWLQRVSIASKSVWGLRISSSMMSDWDLNPPA